MKFLLDHDLPEEIYRALRNQGHEAVRVRDVLAIDTPDAVVFENAQTNHQVMLTCNRQDFLQLAASRPHEGLVVLVRRRLRQAEIAALLRLLRGAGETGLRHNVNFA